MTNKQLHGLVVSVWVVVVAGIYFLDGKTLPQSFLAGTMSVFFTLLAFIIALAIERLRGNR